MTDRQEPPPRLVDLGGPAADCLRQLITDQDRAPLPPRFVVLRERRQRRQRRQRALALVAGAAAAAFCVWLAPKRDAAPSIRAELPVLNGAESRAASATPPVLAVPLRAVEQGSQMPALAKPHAALLRRVASEPSASATHRASAPAPATEPESLGSARECAQIARTDALEGIACYEKLARGTGVSAELALFEQARLEGKALHQPQRALHSLQSYRERFPDGSLRAEVMLAQIDWLVYSGENAAALQLIDEALSSGLARERTPELERVRAKLAAELGARP